MAGIADGPPPGRSVEQPRGDPGYHGDPWGGDRGATRAKRPIALLVVGDVDGPRIVRRLEPYFEIIATADLPTALAVVADHPLDFVLIDAALPDPTMIEVIAQIRVLQWLRDLPIICYGTATCDPAVSRLAGAAARDVIIEPVSTRDLVARITAARSRAR